MVEKFIKNAQTYASDIERHFASGDLAQVLHKAHALKGLSAQFGAAQLTQIVAQIDNKSADSALIAAARSPPASGSRRDGDGVALLIAFNRLSSHCDDLLALRRRYTPR